MAAERFHTAVRLEPGAAVVTLSGELDLTSAPSLDAALGQEQIVTAASVVLDLTELSFMDSSGLRAILSAAASAKDRGQALAITQGMGQVHKLLTVTHAYDELAVAPASEAQGAQDTAT